MKKLTVFIMAVLLLAFFSGCAGSPQAEIAATTLPVYEFSLRLCRGTGLEVARLVTENVSCLHDYTLQAAQMRSIEGSQVVVCSGAGLEDFLEDALYSAQTVIDASVGIGLLCPEAEHGHDHGDSDPHIWLAPKNAKIMAKNICRGLTGQFPEYARNFAENLAALEADLDALDSYGQAALTDLSCRELITFHDGFSYLADAYDLHILKAVEEESGSEASAMELIALIELVEDHGLPAIFTEKNGSVSAASVIAAETGTAQYTLDMAMSGSSYFDAMRHNIDTLKEALK